MEVFECELQRLDTTLSSCANSQQVFRAFLICFFSFFKVNLLSPAILEVGQIYWAPASAVVLTNLAGTFFYRVPNNTVRTGPPPEGALMSTTSSSSSSSSSSSAPQFGGAGGKKQLSRTASLGALTVFGDDGDDDDCCICMSDPKSVVFVPCGLFEFSF